MIRILVVESAETVRRRMIEVLRADSEIEICGSAGSGEEAVELTKQLRPSVVVIGTRLPNMDGFGATKQIMIDVPTPIVVVADELSAHQVEISMRALRAGALTAIPAPKASNSPEAVTATRQFVSTVKAMAQVRVVRHWRRETQANVSSSATPGPSSPARIVAIAASTGGPAALQKVLSELPANFPLPILIVQHISKGFVSGFAEWLHTVCSLRVRIAEGGDKLLPHTVYVAGDNRHLGVASRSAIVLSDLPAIGGFRPSATFLFDSVAKAFGRAAVGVVLTGMGRDGVDGLLTLRRLGGRVIAQDAASSVVFGMPGAALQAGTVNDMLPLSSIATKLVALTQDCGETL